MNQTTRTLLELFGIFMGVLIFAAVAYFLSTEIKGPELANASKLTLSSWEDKFIVVTKISAGLTLLCSLLWYILARFVFSIETAEGAGKRTVWFILFLIAAVGNYVVTAYYSAELGIKVSLFVSGIFVACLALGAYWLTSIFTTPSTFKYTPIGSQIFRHY